MPPTVASLVFTFALVVDSEPSATEYASEALAEAPRAVALILPAAELTPIATEEEAVALALFPTAIALTSAALAR